VARYIDEAWRREVATTDRISEPSFALRNVDYRNQYIKGIHVDSAGSQLKLELRGKDAMMVELGWSPPLSGNFHDGIGTYDGTARDLRPWLFSFGTIRVVKGRATKGGKSNSKRNQNVGKTYRNLRFIAPAMAAQIEALVQPMFEAHMAQAESRHERVSKHDQRKLLTKMRRNMQDSYEDSVTESKDGSYTAGQVKMDKVDARAHPAHANWLYHNARAMKDNKPEDHEWVRGEYETVRAKQIGKRTKFKVFRTIFEDPNAGSNPRSFFSVGVKPAGLISGPKAPIAMKLRDAIKNVISGRSPDGSRPSQS